VSLGVFNLLSRQAPAGYNFWTLMAFLVVAALLRMGGNFWASTAPTALSSF